MPHHNLSLHVRTNTPESLPLAMDVIMHPKLVMYYNKQWKTENLMTEDSLGELIMSHGA